MSLASQYSSSKTTLLVIRIQKREALSMRRFGSNQRMAPSFKVGSCIMSKTLEIKIPSYSSMRMQATSGSD